MDILKKLKDIPFAYHMLQEIPQTFLEKYLEILGSELDLEKITEEIIEVRFPKRPELQPMDLMSLSDGIWIINSALQELWKLSTGKLSGGLGFAEAGTPSGGLGFAETGRLSGGVGYAEAGGFLKSWNMVQPQSPQEQWLVLHYCMHGRCEIQERSGRYAYMKPGTLCIELHREREKNYNFYGERYEGMEIVFCLDRMPREQLELFAMAGLSLEELYENQRDRKEYFLGMASEKLREALEELSDMLLRERADKASAQIMLLRILDLIRRDHVDCRRGEFYLTKGMRKMVMEVHDFFTENLQTDVSVEQIAEKYHVSTVSLNKYFSIVYGDTIYRYVKDFRLEEAAKLLVTTQDSIADVALAVGYENQGKFGAAFRKKYGQSPLDYRRSGGQPS